jgi:phage terminase large subunit-like protein
VIEKAVADGHIILTEGNVLDVGQIYAYIEQLTQKHHIDAMAYDPFNASALLLMVQENLSLPLEKVGQGMSQLSAASKEFYQIVSEKRLHFEDVPFHAWSLSKCTLYEDINSNWKVRKQEVTDKIDPIIASIIALKAMLDRPLFGALNIAVF